MSDFPVIFETKDKLRDALKKIDKVKTIWHPPEGANAIAIHPAGTLVASVSYYDYHVRLWSDTHLTTASFE
ncbi:hypothetical protein BDR03DRAFT_1011669 [Suillus americanus]|nr:hypothetical protein BDR03DRAFT_1011669 [Suillus americanus]